MYDQKKSFNTAKVTPAVVKCPGQGLASRLLNHLVDCGKIYNNPLTLSRSSECGYGFKLNRIDTI